MTTIVDSQTYLNRMLSLPRPGGDKVLAFYEHRVGCICKDPALMLLPLDDHLVHRGDGVFETLKYVGGRLYQLREHVERMERSARAIDLEPPCSFSELEEFIVELARAGEERTGLLRVLLGRGPGGFGIDPKECPTTSLYIAAYRYTPRAESIYTRGVSAIRASIPAKQTYLAKIKSIDYLPNVLMKKEANAKGADFPLCFDEKGFLAEGATENVCIVDADGVFVIPEMTNSLTGTTLMRALELASEDMDVRYHTISEEEIYAAREFIIFGTTADALSIVTYNGKPIGDGAPGPVSKGLRSKLKHDLVVNGLQIF
ncbi:aminotransferase class IV [Desulfovibrio inopinatus]|uniref:aminotransferase class IV n=1 Tax=Desulfovibrio inopinatus TaxID=102109 RepID=UPI00041070FA|nr:aminotransferase class IV [Desulfovibrio inopinatus]